MIEHEDIHISDEQSDGSKQECSHVHVTNVVFSDTAHTIDGIDMEESSAQLQGTKSKNRIFFKDNGTQEHSVTAECSKDLVDNQSSSHDSTDTRDLKHRS